jgi:hypothetical protein
MGLKIGNLDVINNSAELIINADSYMRFSDNTFQISSADVGFNKTGTIISAGGLVNSIRSPNPDNSASVGGDRFGISSSILGNRAIVGAAGERSSLTNTASSGAAYIFDVVSGNILHTLVNPNTLNPQFNSFGNSVDIWQNYAVVGAPGTNSSSGRVYLYNIINGQLELTTINPGTALARFGQSVAIHNNRTIIGAYTDNTSSQESGRAYIYESLTGNILQTFNNPNGGAGDWFGLSVAIHNDRAIVGAPNVDVSGISNVGRAYIYNVSNNQPIFTLSDPTPAENGAFGRNVAINSSYAVVAAASSGEIHVYSLSNGSRLYSKTGLGGSINYIDIDDNYIITGITNGIVRVFNITNGQELFLLTEPGGVGNNFGYSVAIHNDFFIACAQLTPNPTFSFSEGRAYIFSTKNLSLLDLLYTKACSP